MSDLGPHSRDWLAAGLCGQFPAEMFHVPKGGSTRPAKQACKLCTVRSMCFNWIMGIEAGYGMTSRHGVWAGLSPQERTDIDDLGWKPLDEPPAIAFTRAELRVRASGVAA